jgi:hypothetical protein
MSDITIEWDDAVSLCELLEAISEMGELPHDVRHAAAAWSRRVHPRADMSTLHSIGSFLGGLRDRADMQPAAARAQRWAERLVAMTPQHCSEGPAIGAVPVVPDG